jgi:hypothetical protein
MLMELSACDLGAAVSGGSSRGGGGVWRWRRRMEVGRWRDGGDCDGGI